MNSPQLSAEKSRSPQVPKIVVVLMIIILASITMVAIFANVQRLRRSQVETIEVVPAGSVTPPPR